MTKRIVDVTLSAVEREDPAKKGRRLFEIKGEGLIALTRGFMYAGAERVVASLWKVDDAATAELMAQFYKQMFVGGQRPAAALRAAQITLAKKRSPADWAGFVLQGEWK